MERHNEFQELIHKHQVTMDAEASEKTKLWWERYMKGVIPFRGVGIPKNRELLGIWRKENGLDKWSLEKQLDLALAFFKESMAEDKLAGILYLQNFLCDKLSWKSVFIRYEELYAEKLIFDWNVCDWFCVRVLGATLKNNGKKCAAHLTLWKDAEYLWQARSSVVPFVNVATEQKYYPLIQDVCTTLIRRDERFAKTSVGWVLRDISKHDERFVKTFVQNNMTHFSNESMNNAMKYFDKNIKSEYLDSLKKAK